VLVAWALVPTAALLFISQFRAHSGVSNAIRSAVAGTVAMVPEGLVLLTSIAFAASVVRLGRRRVLVQELPAVEGLARVDVLCTDKTGTLTEGRLGVETLEVLSSADGQGPVARQALTALVAADPAPNATLTAIGAAFPPAGPPAEIVDTVPFSSARKWSAGTFTGLGTWVLGAPDVVLASAADPASEAALDRARTLAATGRRVLVLTQGDGPLHDETLPTGLSPVALVVLRDRVRPDAAVTLEYFRSQGVAVKVISGDAPETVAAVAAEAGLEGADEPVDGRSLPEDPAALATAVEYGTVFGRITPNQKREMVRALQSRGHTVAMTGDGVNDALAVKDADIGVAMGSGSAATRGTAQLVLLDSSFASLPPAVAEGRRVIGNIERTANLFVTKTVYAMLLALAIGVLGYPFPFLPRHLTIISTLTIGVPGFFLALGPNTQRARPGFVGRVVRFAVPAGIVAAVATLTAYILVRNQTAISASQERTSATMVLFWIGLLILATVATPLNTFRRLMIAAMAGTFILILAVPALRTFFDLTLPPLLVTLAGFGIAALAASAIELIVPGRLYRTADRFSDPGPSGVPERGPPATPRPSVPTTPGSSAGS
jgi:cation-transporting ATPase E